MSITTKVLAANNLEAVCAYPFAPKKGQKSTDRVLLDGSHGPCTVETAAADFARTQTTLDKFGYERKIKPQARHYSPRKELVPALHIIMSSDTLSPDSPDDLEKFDTLVSRWLTENAPANQAVYALQADGDDGKLHAHIVLNTVSWRDVREDDPSMKQGYRLRRAGRLFTGEKSRVENVRAQVDALCGELGIDQALPTYEPEKVAVVTNAADYYGRKSGKVSKRDELRAQIDAVIDGVSAEADPWSAVVDGLKTRGVTASVKTKTRGKDKGRSFARFDPVGAETGFNGPALGTDYDLDGILARVRERQREIELEAELAREAVVTPPVVVAEPVAAPEPVEAAPVVVEAPVTVVEPQSMASQPAESKVDPVATPKQPAKPVPAGPTDQEMRAALAVERRLFAERFAAAKSVEGKKKQRELIRELDETLKTGGVSAAYAAMQQRHAKDERTKREKAEGLRDSLGRWIGPNPVAVESVEVEMPDQQQQSEKYGG